MCKAQNENAWQMFIPTFLCIRSHFSNMRQGFAIFVLSVGWKDLFSFPWCQVACKFVGNAGSQTKNTNQSWLCHFQYGKWGLTACLKKRPKVSTFSFPATLSFLTAELNAWHQNWGNFALHTAKKKNVPQTNSFKAFFCSHFFSTTELNAWHQTLEFVL